MGYCALDDTVHNLFSRVTGFSVTLSERDHVPCKVVSCVLASEAVFQFKVKLLQVQEPALNSHRRSAMEIFKERYQGLVISFNGE